MNMPSRKSMTPGFIAWTASPGDISPVRSARIAPASMTCQILKENLPTWRMVIRIKTRPSMIKENCVIITVPYEI
jgi:hypothetical protein